MEKLYAEIGGRIRHLREAQRLTQAEVAELCDIDSSFYGQIERGKNIPSLKTLLSIATALNADPGELLPSTKGKRSRLHDAPIEKLLDRLTDDKKRFVLSLVGDLVKEFKK